METNYLIIAQKVSNNPGILIPDRPIAFNRDFVRLGIGVKGSLFLSQAIYWSKRTKDSDGWFYKTNEEWEEETGLTRREQDTVRAELKARGFLHVELRGIPAKNYYLVELDNIANSLVELEFLPNKYGGKRQTGEAERAKLSTTESTTESTLSANAEMDTPLSEEEPETVLERDDEPPRRAERRTKDKEQVFALFSRRKEPWMIYAHEKKVALELFDRGLDKLKRGLQVMRDNVDDQYCPQASTPGEYAKKLPMLNRYIQRKGL
jgi:hypothetical protein